MPDYIPTDRRPIASRNSKLWQALAAALARRNVSANLISILGMIAAIIAGALLAWTGSFPDPSDLRVRAIWLIGALLAQLRLVANLLDGMVAIAQGRASRVGELYNEIPDRVSDTAIFIGAGYAGGGNPVLGYLAACLAIFTAYVRAVGKGAGVDRLFIGPMAKPHRMFVMTLAALFMALAPRSWLAGVRWSACSQTWGTATVALAVIVGGTIWTSARRIRTIYRRLQQEPS